MTQCKTPEDSQPSVGVVILAAGGSSRLGQPKQLLPYKGTTLIRRACLTALESRAQHCVLVLGSHYERIRPAVDGLPLHVMENTDWMDGQRSSLRAGIRALQNIAPNAGAAVIMLCDQPLVTSTHINSLIEAWRATGMPIVASEYSGVRGVPALFAREYWPRFAGLDQDSGARKLIARFADQVATVPFPDGVVDIDTSADIELIKA